MDADLESALRDAAALLARKRPPDRHVARALLVGLGEALLEGRAADVAAPLEQVRGWIAGDPARWKEAIAGELSMAVTEHVRSIDPRYLEHPKFDFVYVVDARHRLEARLRAAEALGVPADDALLEAMERADARLEPHLHRAASQGRGNGTP